MIQQQKTAVAQKEYDMCVQRRSGTHRVSDPIRRLLQIHIHTTCPKLTSRMLQLENLRRLGTEHFTALLSSMLMGGAGISSCRR